MRYHLSVSVCLSLLHAACLLNLTLWSLKQDERNMDSEPDSFIVGHRVQAIANCIPRSPARSLARTQSLNSLTRVCVCVCTCCVCACVSVRLCVCVCMCAIVCVWGVCVCVCMHMHIYINK